MKRITSPFSSSPSLFIPNQQSPPPLPHLFPRVDPVPPEDRGAAGGDPHAGQFVAEHLILLDQPLAALVHVDAAVLAMVDPVVAHDRTALRADLDTGQLVT